MGTVKPFDSKEERDLLAEWLDSTSFDKESSGLPIPKPEPDDPDDETPSQAESKMTNYQRRRLKGRKPGALDRARTMCQYKATIITPGGRVGDNARIGSSTNGRNWVERSKTSGGALPEYIRIVRNGLMRQGHSENQATALAVAAMKRWASGRQKVSAKVRAAAAAALAQWEAMKAESHGKH